jgi:hypothetical protein
MSKKDIVVVATLRIVVKARNQAEALEWVEQSEGAPIDNEGVIVAVESVRTLRRGEIH